MPAKLTIIGERLAREGTEFTYLGETDAACASCKLRKVCQDLEPGRRYRVTSVRDVTHRGVCTVFEGDVKVVTVEPVPLHVAIPVTALRGTGWSKRFDECGAACRFKRYCNPSGLKDGQMVTIDEVRDEVACVVGRKLRFARVSVK